MTCIVGYIEKDKVIIGGDSAGIVGTDIVIRKDTKVFKVSKFIIGYTTSFRMGQILRYSFKPPIHKKGKETFEYMCTDFVDRLRKTLKDGGFSKIDNNVEKGGTFLVGYNGRLFDIESDFQVGENLQGYSACGCGYAYALGAIKILLDSKISGKKVVEEALKASATFSNSVAPPFNIIEL